MELVLLAPVHSGVINLDLTLKMYSKGLISVKYSSVYLTEDHAR